MKKTVNFKTIFPVIILCLFTSLLKAQGWSYSHNGSYLYHISSNYFTWSGNSRSGYCDGYGTIKSYYSNGNLNYKYSGNVSIGKNNGFGTEYFNESTIKYQGYWYNDQKNGFGTEYNSDGSIKFKGNFVDGKIEKLDAYQTLVNTAAYYMVKNIFDGGINVNCETTEVINNAGNFEIKYKISFNGDIINTNYYETTLVLRNIYPYVSFENTNDLAGFYMTFKAAEVMEKWYKSQSDDN